MSNPHDEPQPSDPQFYQPFPGSPPTSYAPPGGPPAAPSQEPPAAYQPPVAPGAGGHGAYQAPAAAPWPGAYQPGAAAPGQSGYPTSGLYDPPGYGVPVGYAMPQPYYPYPYQPPRPHEGLAIASLVVSCAAVLGLCTSGFGGVLGIVGAILGHVARSRIKRNGKAGGGMAVAGIIVGWALTAVCAALVVMVIVLWMHDADTYGTSV